MKEIKNAKIVGTTLGNEDHGIFVLSIHLDYGGSGQSFGNFCLDEPIKKNGKFVGRFGTAVGMDAIMRILEVLGVDSWEQLPGTVLRVESDFGRVYRIGHFMKDKWFDSEKHFEKWGIKN